VLQAIADAPTLAVARLTQFTDGQAQLLGSVSQRDVADVAAPPLADPDASARGSETRGASAVAAEDTRVAYLTALWSQVLGGIAVGADDNFFDLGGNSMHAAQMAERVARDTGFRIKLLRLASQSVAQIAADLPGGNTIADRDATAGVGIGSRLWRLFSRNARGSST
jgi:hypothetical protein